MSVRSASILILLIAALGLAIRLPRLAERPMHCDEAVHAEKFNELWQHGRYVYDPNEYHGPTHYYAALPIVWLSGTPDYEHLSEATLRLTPVLFGVLLIALTALVCDGLGKGAAVWAALLAAVSPAFVYYSRYYIQEMLLVCFTFGLIACGWRFVQSRRPIWVLLAGAFLGLMHATKETCLIAWGCVAAGLIAERVLQRRETLSPSARHRMAIALAAGLGVAILVSVCLFTAFFSNLRGPLDSVVTYATYFDRAGNFGLHNHPWDFYWQRLLNWHYAPAPRFSEWIIVAGAIAGAISVLAARPRPDVSVAFRRFVLVYTALMTMIYTAIPYKTPWCMLGFLHGLILLAGIGFDALVRLPLIGASGVKQGAEQDAAPAGQLRGPDGPRTPRLARGVLTPAPAPTPAGARTGGCVMVVGVLLLGIWMLVQQAELAISRKFAADHRNPYVYSHTLGNLIDLGTWIERVAATHPAGNAMPIQIFATEDDYWPLPWYLRRMKHVGYGNEIRDESDPPDAAIVVVSLDLQEKFEGRRHDTYPVMVYYGLRPGVLLAAYARDDAWFAFRSSQPSASGPTSAPEGGK